MVPIWQDGVFQQRIMEYVVTNPSNFQWNLRHKTTQPPVTGSHGPVITTSGMSQKAQAQT